jgi:hypothetical protein
MEADKIETHQDPHIFYTPDSQMTVRLYALCTGHSLTPGRFLVLISVRGWVNCKAVMWLQGLIQLKNPMTSLKTEPETFQPLV